MAAELKFSVGKFKITEGIVETVIAKCTGITVRYEGNPVDLYAGGCMDPHDVQIGNRAITVSVDYAEWDQSDLMASDCDANRGLVLTLAKCKAVSWEITSSQDGFVTYSMEFRKIKD